MVLALTVSVAAPALSRVKAFADKVAASYVSFDYSFTVNGSMPVKGSGRACVQGDSFRVEADGLLICCDGVSMWSADLASKELVIDNVLGEKDFAGNPALLVNHLEEAFTVISSGESRFQGKVCHAEALSPKSKDMGVDKAKAFFDGKGNMIGLGVTADGVDTEFVISSLKFSPVKPSGEFMFDTSIIDASWVVTDLR